MEKKSEALLRLITGLPAHRLRPFAYTIAYSADLMFRVGIPADELLVTKHLYPVVAKQLGKTPEAVARSVERTANRCWDRMTDEQKLVYIGRVLEDITSIKTNY